MENKNMSDNVFKPEIKSVLVMSTCHITKEVNAVMLGGGEVGVVYYDIDYGYLVIVPRPGWEDGGSVPDCLVGIVEEARRLGCEWVRLDCDGEVHPNLVVYEW